MRNNFKTFFGKLLAVTICATLVAGATPIAGVFADEVSSDVIPVVEETPAAEEPVVEVPAMENPVAEEPVAETPVEETPVTEEPVAEEPVAETPVEETPVEEVPATEEPAAEVPVETPVVETPVEAVSSDEVVSENVVEATTTVVDPVEKYLDPITEWPEVMAEASGDSAICATTPQYYNQPSWYPNEAKGYDAICAYITDTKGEYIARCFFVTDGNEWLLYDYGETAATEFFTQTELKDGKYVPAQKGKSRSDNAKTAGIDESKIPVLTQEAYDGLVYDWRALTNVPFTRDSAGRLVYAGPKQEDPDNPDNPKPSPSSNDLLKYVFTINSTSYEVRVNKEVPYTGRRHVGKWAKNTAKQVNDLDIQVYRNNEFVDHAYYSVKYYNNLNVNGYGKETAIPFFVITLKNEFPFKSDRKAMASKKFGFSIVPVDISTANFKVKKARVRTTSNGVKVSFDTPTVKIADKTTKVSAQSSKNPRTGAYTTSYLDGKIVVYGVNNFTGNSTIDLSAAKAMDYVF
ncbi:hypothetical protein J6S55_01630 [Candidatus Saccharibacteria bacterium]|nr:hypothetical protein [Candidatus Saccharibacteria bacterium]